MSDAKKAPVICANCKHISGYAGRCQHPERRRETVVTDYVTGDAAYYDTSGHKHLFEYPEARLHNRTGECELFERKSVWAKIGPVFQGTILGLAIGGAVSALVYAAFRQGMAN